MEKNLNRGMAPEVNTQLHLFERIKSEEDLIIEKLKISPGVKKHIKKKGEKWFIYETDLDTYESQLDERTYIGEKYNIYGEARSKMIKIADSWYLDKEKVEDYFERMKESDQIPYVSKDPYAN